MKLYDKGTWGVSFIFTSDGSVIPKALVWGLPSAAATTLLNHVYYDVLEFATWDQASSITAVWSGFAFALGFLVVFRSQQAYSRYWEGASLLREIRGEWLNATSSLIAFCTTEKDRRMEVEAYQHLLVRLMSMLHSCSLQTVADMDDASFERFSDQGFNRESLEFLANLEDKRHRCEVLTQWIQRHICNGITSGVVPIAAPILSRVYQELSHGVVNLSNARKLTEIKFPFPISQLLQVMLFLYIFLTPAIAGLLMESKVWASVFTFCAVFSFVGVNYIAMEIESPFGNDPNDLPLADLQTEMNDSLWILLERRAQETPTFDFDKVSHRAYVDIRESFSVVDGVDVRQVKTRRRSSIKESSLRKLTTRTSSSMQIGSSVDIDLGTSSEISMEDDPGHSSKNMIVNGGGEPQKMKDMFQIHISREEEDEILRDLPNDEVSPGVLRSASQKVNTPPITRRPYPDMPSMISRLPREYELLAPPCLPSKATAMLLELPKGAHTLDGKPESSLEERLDQSFSALRNSLTLHIGFIMTLFQQQIQQRGTLQARSVASPKGPLTP